MLYKIDGYPEDGEIVLCTVTKIYHNSVFVNIDEYAKSGLIGISEISPGRIRNLRDFVKEGKKVICKILRVDSAKGHIDLSLRRVNESQKREKNDFLKKELLAEKIVESIAKETDQDFKKLYHTISKKIFKEYDALHLCFEEVVAGTLKLENVGLEKDFAEKLEIVIKQRIKPPQVEISGNLELTSYASNGIDIIKEALSKAKTVDDNVKISYAGAGNYHLSIISENYKDAEKILDKVTNEAIKFVSKHDGRGEFKRQAA